MKPSWNDRILSLVQFLVWVANTFIAAPSSKQKIKSKPNDKQRRDGASSRRSRTSHGRPEQQRPSPSRCSESTSPATNQPHSDLLEAMAYFETSFETMSRSVIKKKYKTLSLIHHPDRNDNSTESIREMQRINHYFDILERELLKQKGRIGTSEIRSNDTDQHSSTSGQSPAPNPQQSQGQSQSPRCSFQQQAERRRQEMEREMRREWQESIRQMSEFKAQRKNLRCSNRKMSMQENLDSAWGRDQSHAMYLSAVDAWQEQIKDQQQMQQLEKPRNALMEYCNEEAVVAMRLGKTNVAIEIIHEELARAGEEWLYYKMRSSPSSYGQGKSIKLDKSYYRSMLKVITRPLDEEKNSILHYAVYLEEHDMISFLILTARRYQILTELILYYNTRAMTAGDYALGCGRGSDVPKMMQSLTTEARHSVEEKTFDARLRRVIRQSLPQHPRDFKPFFMTVSFILFGKYIVGHDWVLSIFIAAVSLAIHGKGDSGSAKQQNEGSAASRLITLHIQWMMIRKGLGQLWKLSDVLLAVSIPRMLQVFVLSIFALFLVPAKDLSRIIRIAVAPIPILDQCLMEIEGYASMLVGRWKKTNDVSSLVDARREH